MNYNQKEHTHQDEILGERISTGENLLGQIVSAKMLDVYCPLCSKKGVKFSEATSIV